MPDVWKKLSYLKDDTAANAPASVEGLNATMATFKVVEDDYSSEHHDTDKIWLDSESMESKLEVSENASHRASSVEESVSEGAATAVQIKAVPQDNGQLAKGQSLLLEPSKEDSHPGLSSLHASLQQSGKLNRLSCTKMSTLYTM